jgi:acylphosphatase
MTAAAPHRRVNARVRGRVQGVGFRATTVDVARRLGLRGWVRNLADGDVELEAEGPAADIESLLAFLHRGPRTAHVDSVSVTESPVSPDGDDAKGGGRVSDRLPIPFETRRTV